MASELDLQPSNDIDISHQGKDLMISQQYCGVCHGALKVKDDKTAGVEDDALLRTTTSSYDSCFPLPSSASAVGTVHPCGHMFHVSCFHNHNNKKLGRKSGKKNVPGNPIVEILSDDGGSCVEIKSSDEFEDSLTEEDFNECPTCRKRAFLFVEMSSTVLQHGMPRPIIDATKLTVEPSETEDDDDKNSDIMNYYSFANGPSEEGENLFVETTNIMSHSFRGMKHSHSDASTEYHDVQTANSKVLPSPVEGRDDQFSDSGSRKLDEGSERREDAERSNDDAPSNTTAGADNPSATVPNKTSKKLLHFDSKTMPSPGIMVTPGTIQRRKCNKKVRFFDELSHSLLECHSGSGPEEGNPALIDQVGSDDNNSGIVEITDEDVREDLDQGIKTVNAADDLDSREKLLSTNESQEDVLNLANAFVLPTNSDSKMLLWNVSTYEEEDESDLREDGFVDKLQREIDTLRHQLIQSEQEREDVRRNMCLTRTRELGAFAIQSKEVKRLKKEIETLTAQQNINQDEILATEEELATTQIQLETAIDTHQQTQARLQEELEKTQEELEDVKYQLETCQEELEKEKKTAASEKDQLVIKQNECHEEIKRGYETKLEELKKNLTQTQNDLDENKGQLESTQKQLEEQGETNKTEKEALVARQEEQRKEYESDIKKLQEELRSTCEELQTTKSELTTLQESCSEQEKTAAAQRGDFEAEQREATIKMKQEHDALVKDLQQTINLTNTELESTRQELAVAKEDLQTQITTAATTNVALVAKHKEDICSVKEEYGAKLEATYTKLANQMQSFQNLEADIKQSQQQFVVKIADLEGELAQTKKSNAELEAELEKRRMLPEASSSDLHRELDKQKEEIQALLSQRDQLETSRAQLGSELERQQQSNKDLQSHLAQTKQEVKASLRELQSKFVEQMESYRTLQAQLAQTKKDSDASKRGLESELARQHESNAVLELQLQKYQEQIQKSGTPSTAELGQQIELAAKLEAQLKESEKTNEALKLQLKESQEEAERSISPIKSELEIHAKSAVHIQAQLQKTQNELQMAYAELEEVKAVNIEESEEMNFLRDELESTRTDMEKLISNMEASDKEMIVLRNELNAAKDALAAATNDFDLQRMSTSTSSLSPRHSSDDSTVQSLQDELKVVKQELVAKNQFIQGQLTMAKGKLIEYVRTKEGELEHTKRELAETKIALKNKNLSFSRQLQETEYELLELSSMKETLLATMNELAEKNSIITGELQEAQAELAILAEKNERLRAEGNIKHHQPPQVDHRKKQPAHALVVSDLKLGNAFAFAAVFMGHWLSECAKARFNLKQRPNSDQADPVPDIPETTKDLVT